MAMQNTLNSPQPSPFERPLDRDLGFGSLASSALPSSQP